MQKNVETEVKIRVSDLSVVEQTLKMHDAKMSAERVYERNVRYEDANETLSPAHRVLRLRQDTRARLTYKEPGSGINQGITSRTELEITVSDFETMDQILQKLGYHAAWIYEKYRTTYEMMDCEVVLDELPFGNFVEIEGETANIEKALVALHLSDVRRISQSYSDLFFRVKSAMKLKFQDLTFENFKGIVVPENYFLPQNN
jgi:adenylate cyclase class 2